MDPVGRSRKPMEVPGTPQKSVVSPKSLKHIRLHYAENPEPKGLLGRVKVLKSIQSDKTPKPKS